MKNLKQKIRKLLGLPDMMSKTEMIARLAVDFGIVVADTAKEKGITMTPELSKKAEEVFWKEIKSRGWYKTAMNFQTLVLAVFEVKEV